MVGASQTRELPQHRLFLQSFFSFLVTGTRPDENDFAHRFCPSILLIGLLTRAFFVIKGHFFAGEMYTVL